jgi:hypothetical protein
MNKVQTLGKKSVLALVNLNKFDWFETISQWSHQAMFTAVNFKLVWQIYHDYQHWYNLYSQLCKTWKINFFS